MNHERAAIMALTFCIGFTTSLIAYGIPISEPSIAIIPANSQPANLAASQARNSDTSYTNDTAKNFQSSTVRTEIRTDGLYVVTDQEATLISPDVAAYPEFAEAGHTAVYSPMLSYRDDFVYYCVADSLDSDTCAPRIFDRDNFSVHSVSQAGEPLTVVIGDTYIAWSPDNRLEIGTGISVSPETPWVLE